MIREINEKEVIALYGLGTETEKAIKDLNDRYNIVGLLDGFRDSGEIYGKRIISLNDTLSLDVSKIIVVARPGSCKAITKRIGDFCKNNNIQLFDIRGKNLLKNKKISYILDSISPIRKKDVLEKIYNADVISFDLFDTLLMRRVFNYTDVFELVEVDLRKQGIEIVDFAKKRLQAEKELSKKTSPKLNEIYRWLINENNDVTIGTEKNTDIKCEVDSKILADIEYEIDKGVLCARKDMIDIFNKAVEEGKKVYITTDTYYSREQIENLLITNGINGYTDILVSCEYNVTKSQGLFDVLKKMCGVDGLDILHIGDDLYSDIESSMKAGVESFRIYNAEELFDAVGGFGFDEYMKTISDRTKVGMINAVLFNSPFQFENENADIRLNTSWNIGNIVCAPMICDFMIWFRECVKEYNIENVWFSARDGYLLKRLYEIMGENDSEYFLTSRIAAIRAGMQGESDISYVDSMKYFGTVEDNLKVRFGIDATSDELLKNELIETGTEAGFNVQPDDYVDEDSQSGLLKYKRQILDKTVIQKDNYGKYINSLNLKSGDIAFFDFVAKGTTQMYVQRLIDNHIKGLYFLQLEPEFMKDKGLDIEPFYSEEEKNFSEIFENYYILETLLTAPHPQVLEFDDEGKPVYAKELRGEKELHCFEQMQNGVMDFFEKYFAIVPDECRIINKQLDEKILSLIHKLKIEDEEFLSLVVEDPFFNRMTEVKDLV